MQKPSSNEVLTASFVGLICRSWRMQSLARFSLKSLVCHTIHDLIHNLTKVVHSHRQMFIISSSLFKKRKKRCCHQKGTTSICSIELTGGARSFYRNLWAFSYCCVKSYFGIARNISGLWSGVKFMNFSVYWNSLGSVRALMSLLPQLQKEKLIPRTANVIKQISLRFLGIPNVISCEKDPFCSVSQRLLANANKPVHLLWWFRYHLGFDTCFW